LRVEVKREVADDPELRRRWNQLASEMERPEVFYTWEWARALAVSYRQSRPPLLVMLFEGQRLLGLAALTADEAMRRAEFLAANTADYCDFISAPQHRRPLIDAVLAHLPKLGLEMLVLANLPADSVTAGCLKPAGRRSGHNVFSRPAYSCARVVLGDAEQRAALRASIAGKKNLRRELARLGEEGDVKLLHLTQRAEVQEELPRFSQTHVQRFREAGRESNLAFAERDTFIRELARPLAEGGWLKLTVLMAGSSRVAWNYGFEYRGSWFYYQPTFAGRYETRSPGLCLLAKMIQEACEQREVTHVDLGLGPEPYKQRFANASRQTLHVTLTTSAARYVKEVARYRAAELAKSSPRVERIIRAALKRRNGAVRAGEKKQ
jgi:CelD/BcsL family acetyltransferase involved in cellulose biosynthesis